MPDERSEPARQCRKCGEVKALSEFHASRGRVWFQCWQCYYDQVREWHAANKDRVTEIKRAHRSSNREAERAKAREKYWADHAATRANRNEKQKQWRDANPERHRSYLAKRRKQLQSSGESFSASDVKELFATQGGKCAEPSCRTALSDGYHVDHIMPLALGGRNTAENIQLLCARCNVKKGSKHPIRWANENGRLF